MERKLKFNIAIFALNKYFLVILLLLLILMFDYLVASIRAQRFNAESENESKIALELEPTLDAYPTSIPEITIIEDVPIADLAYEYNTVHPLYTDPNCDGWNLARSYDPWHRAVDLFKHNGCWINTVADGVVVYAGWEDNRNGYIVRIFHEDLNYTSHYHHGNGDFAAQVGDTVKVGDVIMYMGESGDAYGIYLHLALTTGDNQTPIKPETFIRGIKPNEYIGDDINSRFVGKTGLIGLQ